MRRRLCHDCLFFTPVGAALALLLGVSLLTSALYAGGLIRNAAVGGVAIDAQGVLREPPRAALAHLREVRLEQLKPAPQGIEQPVELRRISLRGLEKALREHLEGPGGPIPQELQYMAGLTKVQYVFVYPEQGDVVLAGPGEGWTVNRNGEVVGKTSGLPIIQLDDLLIALRTAGNARETGISCSIDPRPEGIREMRQFLRQQRRFSPQVAQQVARKLGPQQISITGVPETSHFARVLVAADYRMKRIAMRLEQAPVEQLPSFLDMLAESRVAVTDMMPRWWLACDYQPLAKSDDGLSWELRGRGVKVMTENDLVGDDGQARQTGKANPVAQAWAERMTVHYDQLARHEAVFGQLRNLMDMSVLAALIEKEDLLNLAGLRIPILQGEDLQYAPESWNPPKTVSSQSSFVKRGRSYLITASGGVHIDSWRFASQAQASREVGKKRETHQDKLWWN